jgi:hypothetical protein
MSLLSPAIGWDGVYAGPFQYLVFGNFNPGGSLAELRMAVSDDLAKWHHFPMQGDVLKARSIGRGPSFPGRQLSIFGHKIHAGKLWLYGSLLIGGNQSEPALYVADLATPWHLDRVVTGLEITDAAIVGINALEVVGAYMVAGDGRGRLAVSLSDGETWSLHPSNSGMTSIRAIGGVAGLTLASGNQTLARSANDPRSIWTTRTMPFNDPNSPNSNVADHIVGGSVTGAANLVAISPRARVVTSTNGTSFTFRNWTGWESVFVRFAIAKGSAVLFGGAAMSDGGPLLVRSTDGINYNLIAKANRPGAADGVSALTTVVDFGDEIMARGGDKLYRSSDMGLNWDSGVETDLTDSLSLPAAFIKLAA